jgi:hypothetical protein
MFRKRTQRKSKPFAAYAALLFNASLCVAPFIAARAVSTAYGERRPLYEASSEAIAATRQAIDGRFERLAASGQGQPMEVWAGYVREEMEKDDMAMVNAFLLAAPSMLNGPDGQALEARISVSDTQGEQARIDAALPYLPDDLQAAYERRSASFVTRHVRGVENASLQAGGAGSAGATPAVASGTFVNQATAVPVAEEDGQEFNVLGDMRNLSVQAGNWVHDEQIDQFALILQGIGLTLADREAREGASVLLAARRAQRLDDRFEAYLERKIYSAVPPERVKGRIRDAFQREFGYGDNGEIVTAAFKEAADAPALASLLDDLRVIRDIAHETSPSASVTSAAAAVTILALTRDGADLRKARLVTQAVGNAAPALATYDPDGFLDTAKTVITWNNALKLQLAGLGACFALLVLISLNVLWRSVTRNKPKRRSAVYGLDEIVAES